ncbi:22436_t:CDS:2, partial [Racocetra persica]
SPTTGKRNQPSLSESVGLVGKKLLLITATSGGSPLPTVIIVTTHGKERAKTSGSKNEREQKQAKAKQAGARMRRSKRGRKNAVPAQKFKTSLVCGS